MSLIDGIPSHVMQNLAMVQANIRGIMADTVQIGGSKAEFSNFLSDLSFGDTSMDPFHSVSRSNPYADQPAAGISSNAGSANMAAYMNQLNASQPAPISNPETNGAVKKAYDSLLNGSASKDIAPSLSGILNQPPLIEKLKRINSSGIERNTSLITDEEFFDAESLSPQQITNILKQKGSPYAERSFNGKSIGQLIYDACHSAGTVSEGTHTINPALILSIMGAESGFGKDPKAVPENPFNIRLNGSFNNVKSFEESLNIAVNTMYNWATSRPKDSNISLLDYAGDKYCEDYTQKWKPNVEKYFLEFTIPLENEVAQAPQQKMLEQVLSTMKSQMAGSGLNMSSMMGMMASQKANPMLSGSDLLSAFGSQPPEDGE